MKRCPLPLIIGERKIKAKWDVPSHLWEWLSSKRQEITSVCKDGGEKSTCVISPEAEQLEPPEGGWEKERESLREASERWAILRAELCLAGVFTEPPPWDEDAQIQTWLCRCFPWDFSLPTVKSLAHSVLEISSWDYLQWTIEVIWPSPSLRFPFCSPHLAEWALLQRKGIYFCGWGNVSMGKKVESRGRGKKGIKRCGEVGSVQGLQEEAEMA